jgi:purine-binding chemotaxis protein CheW
LFEEALMSGRDKLLIFALSGLRYALPLPDIERILPAVEITPVPKAPEIVMGLVNVQGRIIPVLNIRKLFRLPETPITLNDHIIIARTTLCPVAIVVDNVLSVTEYREQDIVSAAELFPGIEYLEGVAKLENGILLIYDLERFLSPEEKAETLSLLSQESLPVAAENSG